MLIAMFTGLAILNFFDISIHAFRIAGGLLLVNTGLSMMNSKQQVVVRGGDASFSRMISLAVIPISIPLTTGAGTMSTIILFTEQLQHSETMALKLLVAIVCMTLLIYFSFRYSTAIIKILGETRSTCLQDFWPHHPGARDSIHYGWHPGSIPETHVTFTANPPRGLFEAAPPTAHKSFHS